MKPRSARHGALLAALMVGGCAYIPWWSRPQPGPLPPPRPPPAPAPAPAPPPEKVVRVRVPTPVKCVPDDLGPPPAYPDTDQAMKAAGGAADRYQLLAAGRILRDERLGKLEEVIRKCRQAAHPPNAGG